MTITTEWNDITTEGVRIGVSIKKSQHQKIEEGYEFLADLYDTMEIASILRALKDCNEKAFNMAMERFIEEELAEAEEGEDNE